MRVVIVKTLSGLGGAGMKAAAKRLVTLTALTGVVVTSIVITSQPAAAVQYIFNDGFWKYRRMASGSTSNLNGRLAWASQDNESGATFSTTPVRGGSGLGKDECREEHGWIPRGWYDQWVHHNNYPGTQIKGRVFHMQNMRCNWGTGTLRTELFIHTEETQSQGQSSTDERFRWDGDSDYKSIGCIKVAYGTSMNKVHGWWHTTYAPYYGPATHESPYPNNERIYRLGLGVYNSDYGGEL